MGGVSIHQVERSLAKHTPRRVDDERVTSAVMACFTDDAEATMVLTLRSAPLQRFPGEVSFPGGTREQGDPTLLQTALRETWEEIGVPPGAVQVLGELGDRPAYAGHVVRPFVGVLPADVTFRRNPQEVEAILRVPLANFMDPDRYEARVVRGSAHIMHYFWLNDSVVWGATGQMIVDLLGLVDDWSPPTPPQTVEDRRDYLRGLGDPAPG